MKQKHRVTRVPILALILWTLVGTGCRSSEKFEDGGIGVVETCPVFAPLDFGVLEPGMTARQALVVSNESDIALPIKGLNISGSAFTTPSDVPGIFVSPHETIEIPVVFEPTTIGSYAETVEVQLGDCTVQAQVSGVSVSSLVEFPTSLLFGYVHLGGTSRRVVRLVNHSSTSVSARSRLDSDVFRIEGGILQLPPGGATNVDISYTPSQLSQDTAVLDLTFDGLPEGSAASGQVTLEGKGGGPRLEVDPSSVDFNDVAWFVSEPTRSYSRRLVLRNSGSTLGDVDGVLRVIAVVVDPFDAFDGEFNVSLPDAGLLPGESATVFATVTPQSFGAKRATATLTSNDPGGTRTVSLSATSVMLPACNLDFFPKRIDFQRMGGGFTPIVFEIRNLAVFAGSRCLIYNLEIEGDGRCFSVVEGPIVYRSIDPLEVLQVTVAVDEAFLADAGACDGQLRWNDSSAAGEGSVPLHAQ